MAKANDLRQLAQNCRRLAQIPTTGGHRADRLLLGMAARLEHEATMLDETVDLDDAKAGGRCC